MVDFAADELFYPMDPWQRWLLIHAMELMPGSEMLPRFRTVLVLASRQNGKTAVPVVLSAYWQFVAEVPLILGTSTKIEYAKESWMKAVKLVERARGLDNQHAKRWTRNTNGEQESWTSQESRYKIAASNAEGGRSLTIHRLVMDELRQHKDRSAWGAAVPATNAVPDAQIWCLSNAGDDTSVVLNEERAAALEFIESGEGDSSTGLFEWSAPEDADPLDPVALAQANPNLNRRIPLQVLLNDARKAVAAGGATLASFKTESMCVRVKLLDPAIDPGAWLRCRVDGDLAEVRSRLALCLDISPDGQHATLCAAGLLDDGRVRVEVVEAWDGVGCTDRLTAALPALVARVHPQRFGWFPSGPAAALAAVLTDRGQRAWRGVDVAEIRGEVASVCMGFTDVVTAGRVLHSGDPLLDAHVASAERLKHGDAWRFCRKGEGHVDAVYAAAGAVHLARTLPTGIGKPRIVTAAG